MKTFCGTLAYLAPEVITGKFGGDIYGIHGQGNQKRGNTNNRNRYLGNGRRMEDAYSSKVDMWSIGCLLFVILTAHLPFSGSTQDLLFKNIVAGNYHESLLKTNSVSIEGRDFLKKTRPKIVKFPYHRVSLINTSCLVNLYQSLLRTTIIVKGSSSSNSSSNMNNKSSEMSSNKVNS
ncbi:unnamed protein product [[Candida] boidinii]|nr:unnamed protein product [[Candida] boidinii]